MAAHQAPPSLGFSWQKYWSGLPFPSPVHESEKWKWIFSVVSDSSRPHGLQPTRLLCPWDFPGKGTGVGCHCLLLEITLISINWWRINKIWLIYTMDFQPQKVMKCLCTLQCGWTLKTLWVKGNERQHIAWFCLFKMPARIDKATETQVRLVVARD